MRKSTFALSALTAIMGVVDARAAPADFFGTWENTNPSSNGVVRIVIDKSGVRMFGACTPDPCDYGQVRFITFGGNVSDADHKAGFAHYAFAFKEIDATLHLTGPRTLELEHFNKFTDSSNRQNYVMKERYRRKSQ
jgi:hypothetical protein